MTPPELANQSDAELLRRYMECRDDEALTELVTRHVLLVRGVCQRVLGNTADADDAFQATFLVLIRSSERIRRPQSLAAWLYGVAHRISCRYRRQRRRAPSTIVESPPANQVEPFTELAKRHDVAVFDAELLRLPERYRAPIVLHHLEGKTHRDVAAELQLTEGAVDGLLKRGRNELRVRLARRGVIFGVTVGILQTAHDTAAASMFPALVTDTVAGMLSLDPTLHPVLPATTSVHLAKQELTMLGLSQAAKAVFLCVAATALFGTTTWGIGQGGGARTAALGISPGLNSAIPVPAVRESAAKMPPPEDGVFKLAVLSADEEPVNEENEPAIPEVNRIKVDPEDPDDEDPDGDETEMNRDDDEVEDRERDDASDEKDDDDSMPGRDDEDAERESENAEKEERDSPEKPASKADDDEKVAALAGVVLRVEQELQVVWISLGSDDQVRVHSRFRVLAKPDEDEGDNKSKGVIEVTRILDENMSEARIISQDDHDLIHTGDRLELSAENGLRGAKIALIGGVNLAGGWFNNRHQLDQILETAGIEITHEVDLQGNSKGDGITAETRFLVIGEIPHLQGTGLRREREQASRLFEQLKDLRKQAREQNVRVVSLGDLLDSLGHGREQTQPRPTRPAITHFRQFGPSEMRIENALGEETQVSFVDTSLVDALSYIEDLHNLEILLDEAEISQAGIGRDGAVNLELSGAKLRSTLNLLLEPLKLDYIIKDEVLLITTQEAAERHLELRVYNLADLPRPGEDDDDAGGSPSSWESLVKNSVGGKWKSADNTAAGGAIQQTRNGLVVRQTQRVHREIENLFEQLRRANEAD